MSKNVYRTLKMDGVYRLSGLPENVSSTFTPSFWLEFCSLSKEQKEHYFGGMQQHKGLLYREAYTEDGAYKGELFDLWSEEGEIETTFRPGPDVPESIRIFYEQLLALHTQTVALVEELLSDVRADLPEVDRLCSERSYKLLIRLLHYVPPPGMDLLTHHVDRGLLSLHLFETEPQFQIRRHDDWEDVAMEPGTPVAFCGDQMAQVTDGGLPGMEHRVIRRGDWIERSSAVAFVWFPDLASKE